MKRENDRHMVAAGFRLSAWRRRADSSSPTKTPRHEHMKTEEKKRPRQKSEREGEGGGEDGAFPHVGHNLTPEQPGRGESIQTIKA